MERLSQCLSPEVPDAKSTSLTYKCYLPRNQPGFNKLWKPMAVVGVPQWANAACCGLSRPHWAKPALVKALGPCRESCNSHSRCRITDTGAPSGSRKKPPLLQPPSPPLRGKQIATLIDNQVSGRHKRFQSSFLACPSTPHPQWRGRGVGGWGEAAGTYHHYNHQGLTGDSWVPFLLCSCSCSGITREVELPSAGHKSWVQDMLQVSFVTANMSLQ